MAVIGSIDGPNRIIHLHADTKNAEVDPMDIYKEQRTFRRLDESLRKYDLFVGASGYISKGGGTFTPKLTTCLSDAHGVLTTIVPYDETGRLTIIGEIITDQGTSGLACFDKGPLTPGVLVDINYFPPQVEVIEVSTGGTLLTVEQAQGLEKMRKYHTNKMEIDSATNRLIVYEDNGIDIAAEYDLQDAVGNPSSTVMFKRIPV